MREFWNGVCANKWKIYQCLTKGRGKLFVIYHLRKVQISSSFCWEVIRQWEIGIKAVQRKRFCEEINRLGRTCFNTLKSYHLYFQIWRKDAWQQYEARRLSYVSQVIWSSLIHNLKMIIFLKVGSEEATYNLGLHLLIN